MRNASITSKAFSLRVEERRLEHRAAAGLEVGDAAFLGGKLDAGQIVLGEDARAVDGLEAVAERGEHEVDFFHRGKRGGSGMLERAVKGYLRLARAWATAMATVATRLGAVSQPAAARSRWPARRGGVRGRGALRDSKCVQAATVAAIAAGWVAAQEGAAAAVVGAGALALGVLGSAALAGLLGGPLLMDGAERGGVVGGEHGGAALVGAHPARAVERHSPGVGIAGRVAPLTMHVEEGHSTPTPGVGPARVQSGVTQS